mgnify:FL=1
MRDYVIRRGLSSNFIRCEEKLIRLVEESSEKLDSNIYAAN